MCGKLTKSFIHPLIREQECKHDSSSGRVVHVGQFMPGHRDLLPQNKTTGTMLWICSHDRSKQSQ